MSEEGHHHGTDEALLERLSALVDGELDVRETRVLVARLAADGALRARWERYHLIGEALRGRLPRGALDPGLPARVRARLPARAPAAPAPAGPAAGRRWLTAGLALAASVAAVAVIALRGGPAPERRAPEVASVAVEAAGTTRWEHVRPAVERRLNGYLVSHNENARAAVFQGVMPYARIVAYDPQR